MVDRILIVDDERTISSLIAERLAQEGYSCMMANNGREAFAYFRDYHFSLIISDIRMTDLDGLELFKKVKAVQPNMMFIVMTGYPEINIVVDAIRMGATDFLIKPIDLELLVFSIKKALDKRSMEEEIEAYQKKLEKLVEEKTGELRETMATLKETYLDSVKALAGAIDAKDPYTRGHSDRVRQMSMGIGMRMGLNEEKLENLAFGALLHDIGKIGIRDEILQKKEQLTPEEYRYVQQHPLIGVSIVGGIDFFKEKIPMIRNHHEHFDGSGYPDGLIGEGIPLGARIIAIPDAFDAMASERPHRGAMSPKDVLVEMEKWKGKQFDPQILEIFSDAKIYKS